MLLYFVIILCYNARGQDIQFPTVIDTLSCTKVPYLKTKNKESFERIPFYIGKHKDSIIVGRYHRDVTTPIKENFIIENLEVETKYPWLPDSSIGFFLNENQETILEEYDYRKHRYSYYRGRTLIIQNKFDSAIRVGFEYDIPVIIEAIDKDGKWKAIETRHMYGCGVGLHYILLRQLEIACIIVPIYKGNFDTLLRFKLNNNYSKPFKGTINIEQFDKRLSKN